LIHPFNPFLKKNHELRSKQDDLEKS